MNNVNAIITYAEQHCKKHSMCLTTQRKQVLISLAQSTTALTVYKIIALYKQLFNENIPAMSVYRILEFLENEKFIHKLQLTNKYIICTHSAADHDHHKSQFLICSICDLVKEINLEKSLISKIKQGMNTADFILSNTQLEIHCICNACITKIV